MSTELDCGDYKSVMGTYHDHRGSGIREERGLDGHKVYFLHEANEAGAFFEAAINKSRMGMQVEFPACLGRFLCTGNVL